MSPSLEAKIQKSNEHLSLFDEKKDVPDLVEAVKVRNIKPLHDVVFLRNITDRLLNSDFKGWEWRMVLEELVKSYRNDLEYFVPSIEEKVRSLHCGETFTYERQLLNILKEIDALTNSRSRMAIYTK